MALNRQPERVVHVCAEITARIGADAALCAELLLDCSSVPPEQSA
jgi:hypothetical protein